MAERDRDRGPMPMGDLLRTLVVGRGWAERMALGKLRDGWAGVVGEHLATRSEPARLQRGVLTVRTESGAWASELTLLAPVLARKADAFLGGEIVREVRVVPGA